MKRFVKVFFLCSLVACNNQSSIDKTTDSTKEVVDSQKLVTKDSVAYKSDSNKRVIDSTYKVLKDSMKSAK